jgi:uncharacterized membrane protein
MNDDGLKTTPPQGLQLFYAMYIVTLVFGIQEISEALYKSSRDLLPGEPLHVAINFTLFIAILLLIVRFFWSTGNVRRAWLSSERQGGITVPLFIVMHLPILLFQGVLVLILCFAFTDVTHSLLSGKTVILWFTVVTVWNALWLVGLTRGRIQWPEFFWIANNAALVVFGAFLLLALESDWLPESGASVVFAGGSILSSLADLWITADSYLADVGY